MAEQAPQSVVRRRVFYIPGFDPFPPRRYREIYRREAALQAALSGYDVKISPRKSNSGYGWFATLTQSGVTSEAEIEILEWSDIVQDSMSAGIISTYSQLIATAWRYIASGALFRLMRLRKGPIIAALYPVCFLLVQLALALGLARLAGTVLGRIEVPMIEWAGLVVVWPVLAMFRAWDTHLFAYYLMHDYAFSARWNGAYPSELHERIRLFQERIVLALREDVDEVLVIGHSSGAYLGVSVLADLNPVKATGPALSYLSLGQVVPMVSFLPDATKLRQDLQALSQRADIFWLDVSAPSDGCSFALCNPVAVSGVATDKSTGPLVLSAAFTQTLSAERFQKLRWRFFRLHFQYLCAFDRPQGFDYFQITAGNLTLATRFEHRAPSNSRIETPLSAYRSVA